MATGTTIDGLNAFSSLTAQDEVPVWDAEATGEPTKKIPGQNLANSVKGLMPFDITPTTGSTNPVTSGGIANAIQQSTASITEPLAWSNGIKPTLTNGSHYNNGTYYWKRGSLVYLHISAQFNSAPTNVLLFTLPAGYRPIGDAEITASGGGSYNAKAQCRITENGCVYVTSVDKWVSGSGLFIYAT